MKIPWKMNKVQNTNVTKQLKFRTHALNNSKYERTRSHFRKFSAQSLRWKKLLRYSVAVHSVWAYRRFSRHWLSSTGGLHLLFSFKHFSYSVTNSLQRKIEISPQLRNLNAQREGGWEKRQFGLKGMEFLRLRP